MYFGASASFLDDGGADDTDASVDPGVGAAPSEAVDGPTLKCEKASIGSLSSCDGVLIIPPASVDRGGGCCIAIAPGWDCAG